MRRLLLIGLVLLCGCGQGHSDAGAVPLDQLPPGFLDTAKKTLPNVKFEKAWKLANGTYEIQGRDKNGKRREVEVSSSGEVVDIE
jgi:hypothetical protein